MPGKKHKAGTQAYLLTAAGSDRTGIVYKVSKLLAAYRCNITDLNSKILRKGKGKLYILMLEADFPHSAPLGKIEKDIRKLEKELEIEIQFKPVQFLEM